MLLWLLINGNEPILVENNIVLVEGRLSVREDEETKIVANKIFQFGEQKQKRLVIDITDATDVEKDKLKGALRYFSGDKNNAAAFVKIGDEVKPCGSVYLNEQIQAIFEDIIGKAKVNC